MRGNSMASPKTSSRTTRKTSQVVDKIGFIEKQLDLAISTFIDQFKLIIQIVTALVVANITILGYAISTKTAGMMFVGALIPVMISYVLYMASQFMTPIIYTASNLENKYNTRENDFLISTFLSHVISIDYLKALNKIGAIEDPDERFKKLRKLGLPIFNRRSFQIALIILSIEELLLPYVLHTYFGWQYF